MEVGHCLQCCDKMAEEMGETHTMMGCYYNPIIKHAKKGNCSYGRHQEDVTQGEVIAHLLVNTTDIDLLKSIKYICEARLEEFGE